MIKVAQKESIENTAEPLAVATKEAARLLGVSSRTVVSLAKSGKITRVKIGWRSLYTIESIKRFLTTTDSE